MKENHRDLNKNMESISKNMESLKEDLNKKIDNTHKSIVKYLFLVSDYFLLVFAFDFITNNLFSYILMGNYCIHPVSYTHLDVYKRQI